MMCTILVTGGAGFIGSHLVDALIKEGHKVVVIDNLVTGNKKNLNPEAIFIEKDIQDNLEHIFEQYKFKYVFHVAAQINLRKSLQAPKEDAQTNIIGSLNVIENSVKHKVEKLIFSSTGGAIYSPLAQLPCTESSSAIPESPYGLAKLTIENYLRIMKNIHGLNYVALRYSNVYGPRQNTKGEAGVIAIFIEKALRNEPLTIFGKGHNTRDYVHVSDVVRANLLAMKSLKGEFNVSTAKETSVNEIASRILKITGSKSSLIHTDSIPGELEKNSLSYSKLANGWSPQVDLDKGIQETVSWFKQIM